MTPSVLFSAVAWLLFINQQPSPIPPFTDESHCKSFIAAQGIQDAECRQVWVKEEDKDGKGVLQ